MSDPASSSEHTHELVEQRRPPDDDTPLEDRFETPQWRGREQDPGPVAREVARPGTGPGILEQGHWGGARAGRRVVGLLLVGALVATTVTGYLAWTERTEDNLILLVVSALCAAALWAAMAATRPMSVDLKGSVLTVHHRNIEDVFDLANPFQVVRLRGSAGSPSWSLTLERADGTSVVIGSRTVKPAQLHPVVLHYRAKADAELAQRHRNFGR